MLRLLAARGICCDVALTSNECLKVVPSVKEHPLPQEFVVPGANEPSAALDLARAFVRRAERRAVEMREQGDAVNPELLRYLNRLSDLLFVLARRLAGSPEEPSRRR